MKARFFLLPGGEWREQAEARGEARIAELCDYLQADELTHVRLATRWIREMTDARPEYRDELIAWSRQAVERLRGFYNQTTSVPDSSEPPYTWLTSRSCLPSAA